MLVIHSDKKCNNIQQKRTFALVIRQCLEGSLILNQWQVFIFICIYTYNSPVSLQNDWVSIFPILFVKDFVARQGTVFLGKWFKNI